MNLPISKIGRTTLRSAFVALVLTSGLFVATLRAVDIRLEDGQLFLDAEIVERDDAFLTLRHSTGMATVPLSLLPAEVKRRVGYDPLKAAARIAEVKRIQEANAEALALRKEQEKAVARKIYIFAIIKDILSDGTVLVDATRYGTAREEYKRLEPAPEIGEGWKPKQRTIERTEKREIRMEGIELVGISSQVQIGASWRGYVWPAGERQLKNEKGIVTGMKARYAISPEIAARVLQNDRQRAAGK